MSHHSNATGTGHMRDVISNHHDYLDITSVPALILLRNKIFMIYPSQCAGQGWMHADVETPFWSDGYVSIPSSPVTTGTISSKMLTNHSWRVRAKYGWFCGFRIWSINLSHLIALMQCRVKEGRTMAIFDYTVEPHSDTVCITQYWYYETKTNVQI